MISERNFGGTPEDPEGVEGIINKLPADADQEAIRAQRLGEEKAFMTEMEAKLEIMQGTKVHFKGDDGAWLEATFMGIDPDGAAFVEAEVPRMIGSGDTTEMKPMHIPMEKLRHEHIIYLQQEANRTRDIRQQADAVNELLRDREDRYNRGEKGDLGIPT